MKMQALKIPETVFEPDSIYDMFRFRDASGSLKKWDLAETYRRVLELELESHVPEEIRSYFNSIRNLLLYSFYHYGFVAISAFLATTAVEMALRTKYPWKAEQHAAARRDGRSFERLFQRAIRDGSIREEEFLWLTEARMRDRELWKELGRQTGDEIVIKEEPYPPILARSTVYLRNYFAHPADTHILFTFEMAISIMRPCADVINQLFRVRE